MSTNFFMIRPDCPDACAHCSLETRVHIGKQSGMGGGKLAFGLQGHLVSDYGRIGSWETWVKVLRSYATCVEDEYGVRMHTEDFIAHVERTSTKGRRQFDWVRKYQPEEVHQDRTTLDPDGFTVTFEEFS